MMFPNPPTHWRTLRILHFSNISANIIHMIEVACLTCKKRLIRSPSKVEPRNFCSSECYAFTRNKELEEKGSKTRYTHGHRKNPKSHYRALARLLENDGHKLWKGDSVSYRGLHQWVRRKKGKPSGCVNCHSIVACNESSKLFGDFQPRLVIFVLSSP